LRETDARVQNKVGGGKAVARAARGEGTKKKKRVLEREQVGKTKRGQAGTDPRATLTDLQEGGGKRRSTSEGRLSPSGEGAARIFTTTAPLDKTGDEREGRVKLLLVSFTSRGESL